jgi:hypothetical protein
LPKENPTLRCFSSQPLSVAHNESPL